MTDSNKKETFSLAKRALISLIPHVGGSISLVLSEKIAKRKEQRFEELIKNLATDMNEIKNLNNTFINHEEFLDLFENISKHVVSERCSTKRILYKNLIINSAKDTNANFDKTEKYIRILENITTNDVQILKIFINPSKFNNELDNPITSVNNKNRSTMIWKKFSVIDLLKSLLPNISPEDIFDSLDILERNRFVMTQYGQATLETNGNPIDLLERKITNKGINFVNYILNEK